MSSNPVSGHSKLCKDLADALGLKYVKSLDIRMRLDELVKVTAEFYMEEEGIIKLPAIVKEFYLVEKKEKKTELFIDTSVMGNDWATSQINPEREVAPNAPNPLPDGSWLIDGEVISDFCLREQRLYGQEENGMWTRPKGGGSFNSISMDGEDS